FIYHPSTSAIYTLSLHDALPISRNPWLSADLQDCRTSSGRWHEPHAICLQGFLGDCGTAWRYRYQLVPGWACGIERVGPTNELQDRKSTRLNSSHVAISYAVFCL